MRPKRNVYLIKRDVQLGMDDPKVVGPRIKHLREHKMRVSQEVFAHEVGTNLSSVKRWESGQFLPSLENQKLIAEYFGVKAERIFGDGGEEVDQTAVGRIVTIEKRIDQVEGKMEELNKEIRNLQTPDITDPDDLIITHALKTLSPEHKEQVAQLCRSLMKKSRGQLVEVKSTDKKPKPRQS